jgi:hypothetical protein
LAKAKRPKIAKNAIDQSADAKPAPAKTVSAAPKKARKKKA